MKRSDLERQIANELAQALRVKAMAAYQEARKAAEPTVSMAWRMDAEVTERNADYLARLFLRRPSEAEAIVAAVNAETPGNPWDRDKEPTKEDAWARIPPKAPL